MQIFIVINPITDVQAPSGCITVPITIQLNIFSQNEVYMNSTIKCFLVLLIVCVNVNVFAQSNNALSFVAGNNSNVSIPHAAQINFGTSTNFTIEAWIKFSGTMAGYSGIVAKASASWVGFQIVIVNQKIAAEIRNLTETMIGTGEGLLGSSTLNDDNWHHVAMVVDRSATNAKLYVDGVIEADVTNSALGGNLDNDGTMYIGSERNQNAFVNGLIDEVRIWSVARTQAELLANKGMEINPATSGLSAYYRFNQGTAGGNNSGVTTLLDVTSYHNNGTLKNFALTGTSSNWVSGNMALPVELTSFTAEIAEKSIELKWKTATETNNYGFEIERTTTTEQANDASTPSPKNGSVAQHDWVRIGFIEGNGTTNAPKSYLFTDNSVSGKTLYRLKQIDRDGKFEYSQTVEVTVVTAPKEFALEQNYPNPFNPTTAIGYQLSANSFTTLKVYDAIGREVATLVNEVKEAGYYSAQFDGAKLSSGIYFARLSSSGKTQMKKLLLLK